MERKRKENVDKKPRVPVEKKPRVPVEKIALYVQRLCEVDNNIKNVIMVIMSKFHNRDIEKFANKYYMHSTNYGVRRAATLLMLFLPRH